MITRLLRTSTCLACAVALIATGLPPAAFAQTTSGVTNADGSGASGTRFNLQAVASRIPGFGTFTNVGQVQQMLGNPAVLQTAQSLNGSPQQQGNFLDQLISGSTGNNQNVMQQMFGQQGSPTAGANGLGAMINQIAPGLGNVVGGATGAGLGLNALGNGSGGLASAADQGVNANASGTSSGGASSGGSSGGSSSGSSGGSSGSSGSSSSSSSSGGDTCSAQGCGGTPCQKCHQDIPNHYGEVRSEITSEFEKHRSWIMNTYWLDHILPALMLMAGQLTAAGITQVNMIGALLDAKHQLETQRLMQQMTAEAHKDYQMSEGMCTFGTAVRSLAGSERRSNLAQTAFAQRMNQRQLMTGAVLSKEGEDSDMRSRLKAFTDNYCDQADNANGLSKLCKSAVPKAARRNIDVDYTRNIESRLTLDVDFLPESSGGGTAKEDEQDVFALSSNLYAHNIAPVMRESLFAGKDGKIRLSAAEKYLDLRAVYAKRSVAQNSFAALTAMRASGDDGSAPYTKALIKELGVEKDDEIEKFLGKKPSYFAQMEVLTKKIYQNPLFYTELYDKPANIERKGAAIQAIGLMQDRDYYNSLLRSEAVLAVLLETMLEREQEKVVNAASALKKSGGAK